MKIMESIMNGDRSILERLFSLTGKTALITGSSGGIGRVFALGFAKAGASLALCDLNVAGMEPLVQQAGSIGTKAKAFYLDLADNASIRQLVDQVKTEFGRIDILINCAAVNKREPILEVEESTYDKIMAVNVKGLFQLSQAVVPLMTAGGKIINIGSINSEMALANVSVYGATKGAVKQLTKVMAVEWAPYNIQVNCIIPGFMRTPLSAPLWQDEQKSSWMRSRISQQRPGEPEELLGMAIYLAADASSYVTGQAMIIDGGMMAGGSGW